MDQATLTDIIYVTIFVAGALVLGLGPMLIVYLLSSSPRTRQVADRRHQLIECGMEPIGSAWIRFGLVYYLYALLFLVFDVDILFLLPVAVVYNDPAFVVRDLVEIVIFVGILSLAIVYARIKGVFKWEHKSYRCL
ncbi:MAG: NADH-quinone oxidoreductase subunit A [Deltaproteobacteria bacterium]|nr:MAG: NADH-quinone oxidoreductase subunit A [Deltaproteobacteria bacterium]